MAESVVAQVKEGLADLSPKKALHKPVTMAVVVIGVLTIVLLLEAFKPGLLTGPIRAGLRKLGVKTA